MPGTLEAPTDPTAASFPRRKGGFSMPRNPGLALQEAIQEERATDTSFLSATDPIAPSQQNTTEEDSASEQMRTSASTQASNSASEDGSTEASAGALPRVSEEVPTEARKPARKGAIKPATVPVNPSDSRLLQTVRDNLAAKRNHTGGVKASVDMSPELSTRMKRYLLDNGNPAARILILELVEAFLTEEGY